ncbi:hypothetical protein [Anaerobaca lacustris]|uniref:Uncharacterized protein n=1 Tax=Anaerobaca lacustris TaxID=3044600 RepID=A0AAW6TR75_9BACT|nr:hypothetical protein [Sedimentisphaerales bacterium M17dextr]
MSKQDFARSIVDVCRQHRNVRRALAFAFILYDFANPEISKVLNDRDYWNALHTISGKYLSIYYVHSRESTFGEDLDAAGDCERRGLYPVVGDTHPGVILPILKRYLKPDEEVRNPSILFFQVDDTMISDYFLIELFEERIEDSFLELRTYISSAVDRLKMIDPENYGNLQPIFESLKQGVKSVRFRRVLFRTVQRFPLDLLISWIVGRV